MENLGPPHYFENKTNMHCCHTKSSGGFVAKETVYSSTLYVHVTSVVHLEEECMIGHHKIAVYKASGPY